MRRLFILGVLASAFLAAPASRADEPMTAITGCNSAMYRFFPGEFNFCLGLKFWERQRTEQARQMFELAAAWGSKGAQSTLGLAYFNGERVPRDRGVGLAWLALAAERGDALPSALYVSAHAQASGEDRARAKALVEGPMARYRDDVAAVRADRRYQRELYALRSNAAYGVGTCVDGINQIAGVDPVTATADGGPVPSCSLMSEQRVVRFLEATYARYFSNWSGRVDVGAPQQIQGDATGDRPVP